MGRRDEAGAVRLEAATSPWPQVAARLAGDPGVAVLPFGALEAHGHHLPLGTDTLLATHLARRIADEMDAVLLPALPYGDTWGTAGYPGTVSLSTATVTAIAVDVARSLASAGARALVIVNGDWGNQAPLAVAVRSMVEAGGLPVMVLSTPGLDRAASAVTESDPAWPGLHHADEAETSMVLALAPEQVQMALAQACYPQFPDDFGTRPVQLHPYSPTATFGDPRPASAAKGTSILDAVAAESRRLLEAFLASLPPR